MPFLVSQLLCTPQFSREALFMPVDSLTSERSDLAIAARELNCFLELRNRFKGGATRAGAARWSHKAGSG